MIAAPNGTSAGQPACHTTIRARFSTVRRVSGAGGDRGSDASLNGREPGDTVSPAVLTT